MTGLGLERAEDFSLHADAESGAKVGHLVGHPSVSELMEDAQAPWYGTNDGFSLKSKPREGDGAS